MSMNNPSGNNGYDNGTCPPDNVLQASLLQYAKENLPYHSRLHCLRDEHGYSIQTAKLKKLNKKFDIPSVRKSPTASRLAQLVMDLVDKDTNGLNGSKTIKDKLAVQGHLIPRDTICQIMLTNTPDAVDARYPGRKKIKCTQLTSIGAFAEVCCDGHDKGNVQGLQMGPVSLPVYGLHCKWSGAVLYMVVVPNDRLPETIGHVYLNFVQRYKVIPLKIVIDKGSETGEMYAMQMALRRNYAPDISEKVHPSFVALKSTQNTTTEGLWHWLCTVSERNFSDEVRQGYNQGVFNSNNPLHVLLFYYIWLPICQGVLNGFVEYWNCHKICSQRNKLMPSGATPTDVFMSPQAYGGEKWSVPIPRDTIEKLHVDIPVSQKEALSFIEDDFAAAAETVWQNIGTPLLTVETG